MSRIIAGRAKGRRVDTPKGQATRPTADRVREALFTMLSSWLGTVDEDPSHQLDGIRFLDLFAGSGAIALEAASRGAVRVVAVEKNPPTARLIGDNARATELSVEVRTASAKAGVAEPDTRFDVVFIDPPYDIVPTDIDSLLQHLVDTDSLAARALVVVERPRRAEPPNWPDAFEETWDRRYGETILHLGVTAEQEEK